MHLTLRHGRPRPCRLSRPKDSGVPGDLRSPRWSGQETGHNTYGLLPTAYFPGNSQDSLNSTLGFASKLTARERSRRDGPSSGWSVSNCPSVVGGSLKILPFELSQTGFVFLRQGFPSGVGIRPQLVQFDRLGDIHDPDLAKPARGKLIAETLLVAAVTITPDFRYFVAP